MSKTKDVKTSNHLEELIKKLKDPAHKLLIQSNRKKKEDVKSLKYERGHCLINNGLFLSVF